MATTHCFDTANVFSYSIAKAAANKAGMQIKFEHRPTCCKQYHFEITAETPAQVSVLDLIILATTAHAEQPKYKSALLRYVYGIRETVEKFGQFTIYAEDSTCPLDYNRATTLYLYNGLDEIRRETYYNVTNTMDAARDFMRHFENAYTLDYITAACSITGQFNERDIEATMSDYKGSTTFYFRRYSPDSRYYKQYIEKPLNWFK